jgi:SnoaL-like domain
MMTSTQDDHVVERRKALRTIVDAYFDGLNSKDLSGVPWHDRVSLRTPLAPGGANIPIVGIANVRDFFNGIAPLIGDVTVAEIYFTEDGTSVAARADISIVQPSCTLRVCDRFDVDGENRIVGQENHFDPRPALDGQEQ